MADPPPTVPRLEARTFLVIAKDGPDAARLRRRDLAGHLAHVEANWRRYILAGPFRPPGETAICGSYFLVYAKDTGELDALMRGDPYFTNGQYATVETFDSVASIGAFMGGKIWESAEAISNRAAG